MRGNKGGVEGEWEERGDSKRMGWDGMGWDGMGRVCCVSVS